MSKDEKDVKRERLLSNLGLCVRAGKIVFGVPMICEGMRKGGKNSPVVVFEASDTSENTSKRLSYKCEFYGVKHIKIDCDCQTLAKGLGKTGALAAVALTDENMLGMVEKYI